MTRALLLELAAHLLIVAGCALALLNLVELADPPAALPLLVQASAPVRRVDWPVCTIERGPPLPLQKAYHRNPNGGIA